MKVLLMPRNIGSDMYYRKSAYAKIGIDVKAYSFPTDLITTSDSIKLLPEIPNNFNPFSRVLNILRYRRMLKELLDWADLVHWVYDLTYLPLLNYPIEFDILLKSKKPGVIQWCGSDIRYYEVDFGINKYFREAYQNGDWDYKESYEKSLRNQTYFYRLGFFPIEFVTMEHYIDQKMFPIRHRAFIQVGATDLVPNFPKISNLVPLIVHSPSKRGTKGTKFVIEAIEKLKKNHNLEFVLIENMERLEALELVKNCDIFVDQLIGGGYGSASVEAMGLGKPVLCYINEVTGKNYPKSLPIINSNPENILVNLKELICNAKLRNEIGQKSRTYIEKYHCDKFNSELIKIFYERVIELNQHPSKP